MGRPAFFRGDTPGDLDTEGTSVPPHQGYAPEAQKYQLFKQDKLAGTPEGMGPALSPQPALLPTEQKQGQTYIHQDADTSGIQYRKTRSVSSQISAQQPHSQEQLPGGGREEAVRPKYPPLSEFPALRA